MTSAAGRCTGFWPTDGVTHLRCVVYERGVLAASMILEAVNQVAVVKTQLAAAQVFLFVAALAINSVRQRRVSS